MIIHEHTWFYSENPSWTKKTVLLTDIDYILSKPICFYVFSEYSFKIQISCARSEQVLMDSINWKPSNECNVRCQPDTNYIEFTKYTIWKQEYTWSKLIKYL